MVQVDLLDSNGDPVVNGLTFYLPCIFIGSSDPDNTVFIQPDSGDEGPIEDACFEISANAQYELELTVADTPGVTAEDPNPLVIGNLGTTPANYHLTFNGEYGVSWVRNSETFAPISAYAGAITAVRTGPNAPNSYTHVDDTGISHEIQICDNPFLPPSAPPSR